MKNSDYSEIIESLQKTLELEEDDLVYPIHDLLKQTKGGKYLITMQEDTMAIIGKVAISVYKKLFGKYPKKLKNTNVYTCAEWRLIQSKVFERLTEFKIPGFR